MVDIDFRINGRKIQPNQIGNEIAKALLRQTTKALQRRIGSVRCPKHGQAPRILAHGRSLETLKLDVSGCCDELISMVKARVA